MYIYRSLVKHTVAREMRARGFPVVDKCIYMNDDDDDDDF